jgi:hypothetical protein
MKMLNSHHASKLAALLSIAAGVGCAAGTSEDADQRVGTTAQAFSDGYYVLSWYNNAYTDTGLPASEWTCFLKAVVGDLASAYGEALEMQFGQTTYAGATIGPNGDWFMLNQNAWESPSSAIGSEIMCVPSAANQTPVAHWASYANGGAAVALGSASADTNLVCALVAIGDTRSEDDDNLWRVNGGHGVGSGDSAYTYRSGGEWYLGGSGNAEAWAVCVDKSPGGGWWGWEYSGSGTNNLLQEPISTTQCFLYGVEGSFQDSSSYSDGVMVEYASSDTMWYETTANNKGVGVTCIQ